MRALLVMVLVVGAAVARADVSGSWRVGFSDVPGGAIQDYCRFDLVESAGGEVQGYLGVCILGTDGVLSGTVDGAGNFTVQIVAPDDIGCEVYEITATVAPGGEPIEGSFACSYPLGLTGSVTMTRCDPLTPGSCPEVSGQSLQPRTHEIRACTPTPAAACQGSVDARAKIKIERSDTFHYALTFKLPDSTGVTVADLGDPLTVRDYVACVYHTVGGAPVLAAMEPAWAATTCDEKPCWQVQPTGVKYRNRTGRRGKLSQIKVKVRSSGVSNTTVKGRATTVLPPPTFSPLGLPLTVQLLAGDGACVGATFTSALVNTAELLKAKNGQ